MAFIREYGRQDNAAMHAAVIFFMVLATALAIYFIIELPSPQPAVGASVPVASAPNQTPRPPSKIYSLTLGKLVSQTGADYRFSSDAPANGIQYYAIYYSAQWCPPCHAFTPKLVDWYNRFKPEHHNFELIFVSDDHDEASMLDYMKEMSMPWPALDYEYIQHDGSGIEKYAGDGIPDLVLVDSDGNLLADSYRDGSYVGPESAMNDIEVIVGNGHSP